MSGQSSLIASPAIGSLGGEQRCLSAQTYVWLQHATRDLLTCPDHAFPSVEESCHTFNSDHPQWLALLMHLGRSWGIWDSTTPASSLFSCWEIHLRSVHIAFSTTSLLAFSSLYSFDFDMAASIYIPCTEKKIVLVHE